MIKIRKCHKEDIDKLIEIWLDTSIDAHNFISSNYWHQHKDSMRNIYLPKSETYLALVNDQIVGFVSMMDNFLAAIFVDRNYQNQGIGKLLINYVKQNRALIQLNVFTKNSKSIDFYKSQGFTIISNSIDKDTNESEFLMEWTTDTDNNEPI